MRRRGGKWRSWRGGFSPFPNLPFFLSLILLVILTFLLFTFLFFLPHLHLHVHLLFFRSSSFNQLFSFFPSSSPRRFSPFFIFILPFPVIFAFFTSSPPFFFFFCFISFPCFPFPALLPSTRFPVSLFHPQLLVMASSSSPVLLRVPRILHLPCFPLFHFCCFSFPKIFFSPSAFSLFLLHLYSIFPPFPFSHLLPVYHFNPPLLLLTFFFFFPFLLPLS